MPTFGFSAFLKLTMLNDRPQRTQIRARLVPRGEGYDFHRSLRLRIGQLVLEDTSLQQAVESVVEIVREPERRSVKAGLLRFDEWRRAFPGEIVSLDSATYDSPRRNFRVIFDPKFGIRTEGGVLAVHIWNNTRPKLDPRHAYACMSLFPEIYREQSVPPDDLAVLSLKNGKLYRLGEAADHSELGRRFAEETDALFDAVRDEIETDDTTSKDLPSAPPPSAPI